MHTHLYWANVAGRLAAPPGVRVVSTLHNPDYSMKTTGRSAFAFGSASTGGQDAIARTRSWQ